MKTIFTLMLLLFFMTSIAQDKIYVHTVTAENTGSSTQIDHPDLDGNPDAPIVYVNSYNPGGIDGVYNNNVSRLLYWGDKWYIENEDSSAMVIGAHFNIYIASDPNTVFTHVATVENSGHDFTNLDNPLLNGLDPGPYIAMSHYFNPIGIHNPDNYVQSYVAGHRRFYTESMNSLPRGAAFKVLVSGGVGAIRFEHNSTSENTIENYTIINDPALNGNPNATFVMSHHFVNDPSLPHVFHLNESLGVSYNGSNWCIHIEDPSKIFPENVYFDIIAAPRETVGINDNTLASTISMFPNPAKKQVFFTSSEIIENVTIHNILGQKILSLNESATSVQMDISSLANGAYLAEIKTGNGRHVLRLIKQ